MRRRASIISILIVAFVAPLSKAQDCSALIPKFASPNGADVVMVTANNHGVASFTKTHLTYLPARKGPSGGFQAAKLFTSKTAVPPGVEIATSFDAGAAIQMFSDRKTKGDQPFDVAQRDDLGIEIVGSSPVTVNLVLRTWNNGRVTFTPTCDGNFMRGDTPDVKYILELQ